MTQIISKAVHISMTDALRTSIEDSFSPILDNFEQLVVEDITVTVDCKQGQSTEKSTVKVRIPVRGNDIFVEETGEDMYKVIENAAATSTRQLRKNKEKYNKKGGQTIRGYVESEDQEE
jgi:ribosomal subunit interface protein